MKHSVKKIKKIIKDNTTQNLMSNRQWVFFSVKTPLKLPAHDTDKTPIKLSVFLFVFCILQRKAFSQSQNTCTH